MGGLYLGPLCECRVMPRMTWTDGAGRIVRRYEIAEGRDGAADAEAYLASTATRFLVDCPACGMVYVSGRSPIEATW